MNSFGLLVTRMMDDRTESKYCPYCSEVVLATAGTCKHCGEFLARNPDDASNVDLFSSLPYRKSFERVAKAIELSGVVKETNLRDHCIKGQIRYEIRMLKVKVMFEELSLNETKMFCQSPYIFDFCDYYLHIVKRKLVDALSNLDNTDWNEHNIHPAIYWIIIVTCLLVILFACWHVVGCALDTDTCFVLL